MNYEHFLWNTVVTRSTKRTNKQKKYSTETIRKTRTIDIASTTSAIDILKEMLAIEYSNYIILWKAPKTYL